MPGRESRSHCVRSGANYYACNFEVEKKRKKVENRFRQAELYKVT